MARCSSMKFEHRAPTERASDLRFRPDRETIATPSCDGPSESGTGLGLRDRTALGDSEIAAATLSRSVGGSVLGPKDRNRRSTP